MTAYHDEDENLSAADASVRRQGHSRLVYDKETRTIVTVRSSEPTPRPQMTDRKKLREAAMKATPGPWTAGHFHREDHPCDCRYVFGNDDRMGAVCSVHVDDGENDCPPADETAANQRYIALANPKAILSLLDELDRQGEPVAVKPLEWDGNGVDRFRAGSLVGAYTIVHDGDEPAEWTLRLEGRHIAEAGDVGALKAACRADYEARIRSALAPSPARETDLREALEAALIWHEEQDKALSKQPPSHGPNGTQWARLQHREQIDAIKAALGAQP